MKHAVHRVTSFVVVAPYTLRVAFADGSVQSIEVRPVLKGPLYGPLQDPQLFNSVSLDAEVGTLVWPNGADFDPATLHDWPKIEADFAALAATWG